MNIIERQCGNLASGTRKVKSREHDVVDCGPCGEEQSGGDLAILDITGGQAAENLSNPEGLRTNEDTLLPADQNGPGTVQ